MGIKKSFFEKAREGPKKKLKFNLELTKVILEILSSLIKLFRSFSNCLYFPH